MATLLELNEKAKDVDVIKILDEVISENEKELLELYQDIQLQLGKDGTGNEIGFYNDVLYATEKNKQNPKAGFGNVDLKLTGKFYDEMVIQQTSDFYQITSFVDYLPDIVKKYGMEWAGWNEETKAVLIEKIIYPKLINKLRQQLGI